jgi:type IX secretion system PorP/SprF family membrane protein
MSMHKSILKFGLICLMAVSSLTVKAQQDPYYSHFKYNKQAYNPAAVGEKDEYICLSAIAHNQWLGFDDQTWIDRQSGEPVAGGKLTENVAPVTFNFNINGQIRSNKGEKLHGGIGLSVFDDRIGFMKTTSFKLQGAYFIPIQGNFARVSLGVDLGFTQFGYVNPQFRFRQPNDPRIPIGNVNDAKFDLGFGAYYKQKRLTGNIEDFYAGVSMTHSNGAKYNLVTQSVSSPYNLAQHIYVGSGATIFMRNPAFELEPAILVKYNSKLQFDLNATVKYNGTLRGGLGFRQYGTSDALTIMLGYIRDELQVGYSYDITLSRIRTASTGTHEVFVGYCFQLQAPTPPPGKYYRGTRWL